MLAMKLPPPWSYKQFVTQENHAIILSIYPKRYFEYESNRWACGGGRGDWIVEMEVRVWQGTTLVWSYNRSAISTLSVKSQSYLMETMKIIFLITLALSKGETKCPRLARKHSGLVLQPPNHIHTIHHITILSPTDTFKSQWCEITKERHLLEPRPVQLEHLEL